MGNHQFKSKGAAPGPEPDGLRTATLPSAVPQAELSRATKTELAPESAIAKVLKDNKHLSASLNSAAHEAHAAEPIPERKPARTLEALVGGAFKIASQGPEFLLPAIACFITAAHQTRDLHGVDCPTIRQAFVDTDLLEQRSEALPVATLLTSKLQDLTRGSASESSAMTGQNKCVSIFFGVPIVELASSIHRLLSPQAPIESALLTSAFLTLAEEALHAVQRLNLQAEDRVKPLHKMFEAKNVLLSELTLEFLAGITSKPEQLVFGEDHSKIDEIDVLASLVEHARNSSFPIECLFQQLSIYHAETRAEFVAWLQNKGLVPEVAPFTEFYFAQRGTATKLAEPKTNPKAIPEEAQSLLELLREAKPKFTTLKALGTMLNEPLTLELLQARCAALTPEQLSGVVKNVVQSARDGEVLPKQWASFAQEELKLYQSGLAAVVLEHYLLRIGYLRPRIK